jgi:hypothetical protein
MSDTAMRTLATDKVSDIIQVDTVRVTKVDMAKAEKVAKADRLGRLAGESADAVYQVRQVEGVGLVHLVDAYRAVGAPIVVAIRDGLAKGVRSFVKVAVNGETVESGRYVNESRFVRGHRIADHWQDGETTADCVARFLADCQDTGSHVGISEFVRWIGGSESKPTDPAKALRAALRAFYKSGGTYEYVTQCALENWDDMGGDTSRGWIPIGE